MTGRRPMPESVPDVDRHGRSTDDQPESVAGSYAEALLTPRPRTGQTPRPCSTSSTRSSPTSRGPIPMFAAILASRSRCPRRRRTGSSPARSRAGPRRWSSDFLRVLNRHGRLALLIVRSRPRRGALWDRQQNRRPGARPLGRPARRRPDRARSASGSPGCSTPRRSSTYQVDPRPDRRPGRPGRRRRLRRLGPQPTRNSSAID